MSIPFLKEDTLPPGQVQQIAPGVRRVLFASSVRDNIALGSAGPVTDEQVEAAARLAGAHDFVRALPFAIDLNQRYLGLADDELLRRLHDDFRRSGALRIDAGVMTAR